MRIPTPLRAPAIPVLLLLILATCGFILSRPAPTDLSAALGPIDDLPPALRAAFAPAGDFLPKRPPAADDWLALHNEPGQSFHQWLSSGGNLPDSKRRTIHLLPIGDFHPDHAPSLDALRELTAAWFHPLPVELLPAIPDAEVTADSRINPSSGRKQWRSDQLLTSLHKSLPRDSYCMIGVTMTDLYPDDRWNYVFGQASLRGRIGVFSFARYHPSFFGDPTGPATEKLVLRRAAKVLLHETGHLFGIPHCIHYECNLNGANHLEEIDRSPLHLCPVCLRKIHHATGFDPFKRHAALRDAFRHHGLDEEARFTGQRLARIHQAR